MKTRLRVFILRFECLSYLECGLFLTICMQIVTDTILFLERAFLFPLSFVISFPAKVKR